MGNLNQKPHIAIVCDTVPYPYRSGDNQRIADLILALREKGWYVHLVLCGFLDGKQRKLCRHHVDALHEYHGVGLKRRARNGLRRTVRFVDLIGQAFGAPPAEDIVSRLLGRAIAPVVLDYWQRYPHGLDAFVFNLTSRYPIKAVIVEYIWLYPAAAKLNHGIVKLLDTHDIQHKRVEQFASRGLTFPLRITRDQEANIFNQFDSVIAIQSAEAELVKSLCPNLRVLTAGTTGSCHCEVPDASVEGRVLYVGGYNGANIDGLRRFLEFIWPRIREQCVRAHLHVCGYVHRAFIGERFDNVNFLGHVEYLDSEYAAASVVINPSWIGTGLKIKSIEALARGKPLVSTSKGVDGVTAEVMKSARVHDDDAHFGNEVVALLSDHQARLQVSQAAKQFAKNHLNPHAVYKDLFGFLNERQ